MTNDLKVLRYCRDNAKDLAKGKLESPEKLTLFYAGYTAMRSIWDARTKKGKDVPDQLHEEIRRKEGGFIFRVDQEISHSIGKESRTLLRVSTFKFWADSILEVWG